MAIITFTSDFGNKDYFVSAVKGAMMQELEQATLVDISHDVAPFNIAECAYIIENAYPFFPQGTIHIIGVDAEKTPENQHLAVFMNGHYFICANNGLVSLITHKFKPEKVIEIKLNDTDDHKFAVASVFVKAAAHLARGGSIDLLGTPFKSLKVLTQLLPTVSPKGNEIRGAVLYVDNYGNVVTNITKRMFDEVGKARAFHVQARNHRFDKIYENYADAIRFDIEKSHREEDGKQIALFNSGGYLELSVYKSNPKTSGGASSLFGLHYRDSVTVFFGA